ncbi:MAG: hypothetical protein DCC55_13935 [Chloroflexi bacterium]|nr:MAG: hypothetical protein DCC55_13935 [Chloroflexota bacterium]
MFAVWTRRPLVWGRCFMLLLIVLALLAGCAGRSTSAQPGDLRITLVPAPEGVSGSYLTVLVADAAGTPVTDAAVRLEGNMNHAGMAPVLTERVRDEDDGQVDGSYRVPFGFTMLGDWIITVTVERSEGTTEQHIDVGVTEGAVEVKQR